MKLTEEQSAIINSTGNIKINAVAGSGKTTTMIEYALTRPTGSKILYLAFNRSVKTEAQKKFEERGLDHVKVETAHSLAYRHVVRRHGYKVRNQGYKTHELAELLGIEGDADKHTKYIVSSHIGKFVTYFCNSDKTNIRDLNYLDTISDNQAKLFVKKFYAYIEKQAERLLQKMDQCEIEITHDFYLKKFQLEEPQLDYDYILFDEGQDASSAMLSVFLNQNAVKVIVGDTHQQIYGWRHAVNSLEKTGFKALPLTISFRFSRQIAELANGVLEWKNKLGDYMLVNIKGAGTAAGSGSKAIIARTNQGLLLKAIEYVTEKKNTKHIYFEGNINSYTYAEEGASLYDVLSLYNRNRGMIRDRLISSMKDLAELEEYIDKTEDVQLGMMVDLVKEYGNKIPGIIKAIKEKHVENNEKEKAEVIFSTVHRCKGMEYDAIELANDFISAESIDKIKANSKDQELNVARLNEEINLLYVAVTRTKNSIHIPENLLPSGISGSSQIHPVKTLAAEKDNEINDQEKSIHKTGHEKSYSVSDVRKSYGEAYKPWSEEMDGDLKIMYHNGTSIKNIAEQFGRTKGAIYSMVKKLELGIVNLK